MNYKEAKLHIDTVFNWLCSQYPTEYSNCNGYPLRSNGYSWYAFGDWWYDLAKLTMVSRLITPDSPVYNDFLILFKAAEWPEKKWLDLLEPTT